VKISVVTVSFNSARTIGYTLESFFRQSHPEKELVVVDGASSDETLTIVRSFQLEGMVVISERDAGIYDAMNKGLAAFSGEAVGFLNSDDRFKDAEALAQISDTLQGADVVYGNLDFVAGHNSARVVRRWRGSPFRKNAFAAGWMPAHPTFYVRRAVVDAVGKFDLSYEIAADYDYMLRAMELHDFRTAFVDRVFVDMMHGGESNKGIKAYLKSNYEAHHSRRVWLKTGIADTAIIAKPLRKVTQFLTR
jgi:glycosyltransferase involved in cell wall biosynthesis